jgi:hypothetical protein
MEGEMDKKTNFLNQLMNLANELAQELDIDITTEVKPYGLAVRIAEDEGAAQSLFDAYSWKFGYPKDWFGKTFVQSSTAYKIVGVKPTAEKNCLRIMRIKDGKEFVCGVGFCTLPKIAQVA